MVDGRVEVHGTVTGFVLFGLSLQDLYWYDKLASKASRLLVVGSGRGRPAYACQACGLLTIDTKASVKSRRGRGL